MSIGKARQPMTRDVQPTETQARAGRYIRQPTGYRAFIPAPLPPNPPVALTGVLQQVLSEADRALGRLDGSIQTLPNPDLFVYMYVRNSGGQVLLLDFFLGKNAMNAL